MRRRDVLRIDSSGSRWMTTFILTYALAKQTLAVGLAAVGGMLAGVIVTLVSFSVGAVVARGSFMSLLWSQLPMKAPTTPMMK